MGSRTKKSSQGVQRNHAPALDPEARQAQMISYAINCAEQQLKDGTASPSVICHYLKLGTTTAQLEKEKLELENRLLVAKTEAIQSSKEIEKMYAEAMSSFRRYHGEPDDD